MSRPPEPLTGPATRAPRREGEARAFADDDRQALARRLRQQTVLAAFGKQALTCRELDTLLQRACELCAEGMETKLAKVLEWRAGDDRLLVRAGVGWPAGVVGQATLSAERDSPAGHAFKTGEPVISNDLADDERFRTSAMLAQFGVRRAINVPLVVAQGARPWGVLEVDSTEEGRFEATDLDFLQGFANLLGVAMERDLAEAGLADSRERYRLVTQATTDVIWDWDLKTDAVSWSEAMHALAGGDPAEVVPTLDWWAERVHPEDRERVWKSLHDAIEAGGGERWRDEYRFRRADGSYADIVDQGFVQRDAAGKGVRMIGGMLDVTDLKRVEGDLRETQERLHAALDAAEMGALDFDPRSGELHLDERCMRLLGLPPDAEMSYERLLQCVGPDDQAAIQKAVAQSLDPNGTGEFYVEVQVPSPQDQEVHYIAARGRVLIRPRRAARVVGIAFDVTYRRRAEDLMREALEHKDMLVREVSHRVKNSLQLVAGVLALQARGAQHEEVRQALTVAQTRLQTIGQIHDQLWRQPDVQEVELGAFLRSLCEKLQESTPGHVLTFAGPTVSMTTDRAVPVALLVNELVTNAFKYAYPEGGPVEVLLSADGERLTLEVADQGVGLPPDLDLAGEARESLGMRVVSGLVRQLGAECEARDNAPGARFVLRFDRVDPAGEGAT